MTVNLDPVTAHVLFRPAGSGSVTHVFRGEEAAEAHMRRAVCAALGPRRTRRPGGGARQPGAEQRSSRAAEQQSSVIDQCTGMRSASSYLSDYCASALKGQRDTSGDWTLIHASCVWCFREMSRVRRSSSVVGKM